MLLDEMRDQQRQEPLLVVKVLLGSIDCLREVLTAIQDDQAVAEERVASYKKIGSRA
jgi:hypothetical protein